MTTQYLNNSLNKRKCTKNVSTALDKHEKNENHTFNFSKTKILNTTISIDYQEMFQIEKKHDSVQKGYKSIVKLIRI